MEGTKQYYKDFGRASEKKAFIKERELKIAPSGENSRKISYELEAEFFLIEINACLKPYVKQAVYEPSVISNQINQ